MGDFLNINNLNYEPAANITAKTAWQTAPEFRRDSALVKLIQNTFKLTDDKIDDLFRQGIKITA